MTDAKYRDLRIAVRADASQKIGTGHIFRSMAAMERWRDGGGGCVFVCRSDEGHLMDFIAAAGFPVRAIDAPEDDALADARAFALAVREEGGADAIWVDHYSLDRRWERAARDAADAMLAIDDLADRPHDADIVVDAGRDPSRAADYDGLLAPEADLLLGLHYVLLRREFTDCTPPPPRSEGAVGRLLVTLGGNDPLNATGLALDAFDHPAFAAVEIDVTIGTANPRLTALAARAAALPNVTAHIQHGRMSDLMAAADLCLGAGGTTSWERCYMGLPTVGLVLADNQTAFMAELEALGVARNLGWANTMDAPALREAMLAAMANGPWRAKASRKGGALIDGKGVERTLDALAARIRR
ncbi:MAG: UDP-2,4-diacetamido-2,4,6-trideoxy-beta-L-altropyranose hydrolase [Pseudomonadota bacterium]